MASLGDFWEPSKKFGCPQRRIGFDPPYEGSSQRGRTTLCESILRFPSAPVFATHEARQHAYKIKERWPNFHTMRVLTRKDLSESGARHIFLLHNGLNETQDISFHYRLANWILSERPNAACIIRPLPGHFSRYFFQSPFAELPLDEYLQDPASVFRQFLRYMLETQWLLSALVPWADYKITTGCELLCYDKPGRRIHDNSLGKEIQEQANLMLTASRERSGQQDPGYSPEPLEQDDVVDCVKALRSLLGWSAADHRRKPRADEVDRPAIHVVGYSMGGFVAQSIFCTWPYAISSCSNLFAGGALRDLAPTAFAHPEEWQSVLHGLRSELDHARIRQRLSPTPKDREGVQYVVGIKRRTFEYFERVFEDVFLQSDRGSYSTRLAEFSRRMLFVLGGDDPIVRTRNVLDAAPPGGITLHQISDVSHFQDASHKEPAELEQSAFWLPETGRMIGRFAERTASLLQQVNGSYWDGATLENSDGSRGKRRWKRQSDGGLANMHFEHVLDSMIGMVERSGGWLFIARNQIPTVFLDEDAFRVHAAAMHHSEDLIGDYADGLAKRAERLWNLDPEKGGFSLLIPSAQVLSDGSKADPIKPADTARDRAMFSKSEVAIRYWPDEESRQRAWVHFLERWCQRDAVRSVEANEYLPPELGALGVEWKNERKEGAEQIALTMLPDVWVAFDRDACYQLLEADVSKSEEDSSELRSEVQQGMVGLATKLAGKKATIQKRLMEHLAMGSVKAIKVSPAEFNPRYRGQLLDGSSPEAGRIDRLLVHWAMAYEASTLVAFRPEADATS